MRFRKYDLILIAFSIVVVFWIGLTKTGYHLELDHIVDLKLPDMPSTIGEYWAEGKMPVQRWSNPNGFVDIIDLGHTSPNPFDYVAPSFDVKTNLVDPSGTILRFSIRDVLPEEANTIKSFNNGDFIGLREYAMVLGLDAAYLAGRYFVDKHLGKRWFPHY